MEIRQVEYFIAVANELSFTRAAERVHVVQSALSTSIAKLERELGVALFDRSRQHIKLTRAGERFRTHAYEIIHATRAAGDSVGEFRGELSGTVEFGSLISFGPIDVPKALGDFHRAHPLVRIRLYLNQSGASAYLSGLVEGSLDLALVSVPNRFPPQLDMQLLFEESMVFVCRPDHPLADRRRIGLGSLAEEDLVGFPPEFGLRNLMDEAFHTAGFQSHTPYEVPTGFGTIAELVSNGLGTAFMPKSEAQQFEQLTSIALHETVTWQVYLASPPVDRLTSATARLAETMLDAAADARATRSARQTRARR